MAVDAEDLLIRPFRDVVAAGTVALTNASTHAAQQSPAPGDNVDRMARAAQAIVREGERALNKVQLVWNDQVSKHGDSFGNMMVQQASIEKRRLQLEDLLWDFDDFTQPADFDQARYGALQAATKALALDIIETARRIKPQAAVPDIPAIPQGGFPPLPPLPPRAGPGSRPPSARSIRSRALSRPRQPQDDAVPQHEGIDSMPQSPRTVPRTSVGAADHMYFLAEDNSTMAAKRTFRSQSVASQGSSQPFRPDLTRDAFTPPASPGTDPVNLRFNDLTLNTTVRPRTIDSAPSPSTTHTRTSVMSHASSSSSSALLGSLDSLVIPEDSTELDRSSTQDTRPPASNAASQDLLGMEDMLRESCYPSEHRKSRPTTPRIPDLGIRADSTYYKLKGLCKGATKFRKDGHWDSIKLTNEYEYGAGGGSIGAGDMMRASDGITVPFQYETTKVGACGDCGYAHDLDEVELDKSNRPEAVRASEAGPRYRLRLLFKSHLRQGSSTQMYYACLWCVQAGAVSREGDATVFRSAEELLRHLARHPQPLAPLAGVTVVYGRPLPDSAPQDFDLHLPESPTPVPMPENVARLATAIAVKDHYRRLGRSKLEKPPKYDADMLEFMEGARIVGVIFPEKWGGKYCLGRHDGEFGAFPAKAIELRPPQESEIPVGGESGMSVTTRWKWQPPPTPGAPWLSFGKGEVITNVQCLYADYWCWSGTNSKGKTGVFPQSFIDLETLRGQESTAGKKQSRSRSLFGSRPKGDSTSKGSGHRNSVAS
ncbi:hypothetical protein N657DRAFT_257006 [Parathielavia appendiculata]|uniref:SH3 domain-containing protein n=1 Tax=Parathielavia appendiculata TaxID=2587402 RepID=A0AAN6TSJ6_9PEZI|nr:hypothetical protein N657DRAFT_257006 [Parathielavia appendiculata]